MIQTVFIVVRATEHQGKLHALLPALNPHIHQDRAVAKLEAERLAKVSPGERFYVMEAIGFARTPRPVHWHECNYDIAENPDDEIPF